MRKKTAAGLLLVMVLSAVFASASNLQVGGGTLQVIKFPVAIAVPDTAQSQDGQEASRVESRLEIPASPTPPAPTLTPTIHLPSLSLSLNANGMFDALSQFGVTGQVCLENTGSDPLPGIPQLNLQVIDTRGLQAVEGALTSLKLASKLVPGEQQCLPFLFSFAGLPGQSYHLIARVELFDESDSSLGEVQGVTAQASFSLPGVSTAPTTGPTATLPNPTTLTPTQTLAVPSPMPTETWVDLPPEPTLPTEIPIDLPTVIPTEIPSLTPTPTEIPAATSTPPEAPTELPDEVPTDLPTEEKVEEPTEAPPLTAEPVALPSEESTAVPVDTDEAGGETPQP